MTEYSAYAHIKPIFRNVISGIIDIVRSRWRIEWSFQAPTMGEHFYYEEIEQLNSFKMVKAELLNLPNIKSKYSESGIEKPIFSFIDMVLASLRNPERLDYTIEDWWPHFCEFIDSTSVDVRLLVGLSNFHSDKSEYQLGTETKVKYFGNRILQSEINHLVPLWRKISSPQHTSLSRCNGVLQVDFSMPATEDVLEYMAYSRECIKRMIPLREALQLCGFGYIGIGPWISILNPKLPMDDVAAVGETSRYLSVLDMPKLLIDQDAWNRFSNIYELLMRLHDDDKKDLENGRAVRRRFRTVMSRFAQTFEKGLWESVIVDIVILMESILTPNKQGGRMQLALAASNLLGTTDDESREIYDNVNRLYSIRNSYVHGEPTTQEKWEDSLYEIAVGANWQSATDADNQQAKEYAIEVARDYARRSISAMLNLYYSARLSPSDTLTKDLHRLHLDKNLKSKIQSNARCYSFLNRKNQQTI
jgi:hypothetical protein